MHDLKLYNIVLDFTQGFYMTQSDYTLNITQFSFETLK